MTITKELFRLSYLPFFQALKIEVECPQPRCEMLKQCMHRGSLPCVYHPHLTPCLRALAPPREYGVLYAQHSLSPHLDRPFLLLSLLSVPSPSQEVLVEETWKAVVGEGSSLSALALLREETKTLPGVPFRTLQDDAHKHKLEAIFRDLVPRPASPPCAIPR